jgi:hypothetical protein
VFNENALTIQACAIIYDLLLELNKTVMACNVWKHKTISSRVSTVVGSTCVPAV